MSFLHSIWALVNGISLLGSSFWVFECILFQFDRISRRCETKQIHFLVKIIENFSCINFTFFLAYPLYFWRKSCLAKNSTFNWLVLMNFLCSLVFVNEKSGVYNKLEFIDWIAYRLEEWSERTQNQNQDRKELNEHDKWFLSCLFLLVTSLSSVVSSLGAVSLLAEWRTSSEESSEDVFRVDVSLVVISKHKLVILK